MNLQIRDPRAHALARELAKRRHLSLTDAVILALEAQLKQENDREPLADRLAHLADQLQAKGQSGGRDPSKDEIDALWGHG